MSLTPDKELFNLDISQIIAVLLERLSLIKIPTWSENIWNLSYRCQKKKGGGGGSWDLAWVSAGSPLSGFASRGPSSQLLCGQTMGNICCTDSSGSCCGLRWHLHSPKSFWWLFVPSEGVCSLTYMDLTDPGHPYRQGQKNTIKMGNGDFGRKAEEKGSSNTLQRVGGKCSVASPSNASPSESPVGIERCMRDTVLTQPPPFLWE